MRVAILTALHSFDNAYSLGRVIRDQVATLEAVGHDVTWFVKKGFDPSLGTHPRISDLMLPGYMHEDWVRVKREFIQRFDGKLNDFDAIFVHDLWFAPMRGWEGYREGIRELAPKTKAVWFHWTHSTISGTLRGTPECVPGHVFVALNHDAVATIKRYYGAEKVEVVWNPSDVTDLLSPDSRQVVERTDLLNCDVLGVLPFPIGRLEPKGIPAAMRIYASLAQSQRVNVLLCGGRAAQVTKARMTTRAGTTHQPGRWVPHWTEVFQKLGEGGRLRFWWAHELGVGRWHDAVPNRVVRELMPLSTLFLWPTHGEACSLAIAEARTSGGPLVVLPADGVQGMREFADEDVVLVDWTSAPRQILAAVEPGLVARSRRLRRQYEWSRTGLWRSQLKPMLERHCAGTW